LYWFITGKVIVTERLFVVIIYYGCFLERVSQAENMKILPDVPDLKEIIYVFTIKKVLNLFIV